MAWGNKSGRTTPLPKNWYKLRQQALTRDNYQCTEIRGDTGKRCTEKATDVDHIGSDHDHNLNNLRSLCSWHHARKTARQGGMNIRQGKQKKHPGLIA